MAHGGTLFLDEIGALPMPLQAKILTAVDERAVRRVGALQSERIDFWLISATNEPLLTAVCQRRFREDLYHRIAAVTLTMPPLRERGTDILRLADHFLAEACREYGLDPKRLSFEARDALLGYRWPGNVRELANVMVRAALSGDETSISPSALGLVSEALASIRAPVLHDSPSQRQDSLDDFERSRIFAALEAMAWNTSRTAGHLGMTRNTLRYRMKKLGLQRQSAASRDANELNRIEMRLEPVR
jgi:DNA-binding NtrC family response regulator